MRRISLWLVATVATLVLLFSYRTSINSDSAADTVPDTVAQAPTSTTTPVPNTTGSGPATLAPPRSAPPRSATPSHGTKSPSPSNASTGTYQGSVVQTKWGQVQVTITVTNGKITKVSVPIYPNSNGRDQEINARALPILKQETLAAQNADIDTVSGATYTSRGYIQSLQAALDAAHLA